MPAPVPPRSSGGPFPMILMACPACDRQYDVSHLEPGRSVRCLCDEVFTVRHRAPSSVGALLCSHCGGPVGADDEACPFCAARLDEAERNTTLCPACFARVDDTARHCSGCGVAIAPQALLPIPAGRSCPRCADVLRVRSMGERSVVECSSCEGLWLTRAVFEGICRDALRSAAAPLPSGAAPDADAGQGYIACLDCDEPMMRQRYRHDGRTSAIVVDACRGHGIWLDRTELERVVAFVRDEPVGLQDLGSVSAWSRAAAPASERALPTVVPAPDRPHPVVEAVRYLARAFDDFLG